MKMSTYPIKGIFRLESGTTVLACEGETRLGYSVERTAKLSSSNELRQSIHITGRPHFKYLHKPPNAIAFETRDNVQLSLPEAESGMWLLTIDEE
jgi:hypothetical protein